MKTVVQRVTRGEVRVAGDVVGRIERGLVLLVGVEKGDGEAEQLRAAGLAVETGRFGADMAVDLVNDGPVTFWLETRGGALVK